MHYLEDTKKLIFYRNYTAFVFQRKEDRKRSKVPIGAMAEEIKTKVMTSVHAIATAATATAG
jgi:hypothetical protein